MLLGTSLASSGGSLHSVSQLVLHAGYSPATLDNDVAIVRLAQPAVYSNLVRPARIPGSNYDLPDGTLLTTIGWGSLTVIISFVIIMYFQFLYFYWWI